MTEQEIAKHTGLAIELASKYYEAVENTASLDIEDIQQEALIALYKSAEKYDPERGKQAGCQFQSYAGEVIKQQLRRYIIRAGSPVHIPEKQFDDYSKIQIARRKLYEENPGISPSTEEISKITGFPVRKVVELIQRIEQNRYSLSLNCQIDDEAETEMIEFIKDDSLPAPEQAIAETEMNEGLKSALRTLTKRELSVIALYYGLAGQEAHTYAQIGKLMKYSHEYIRQIHNAAIIKIRKVLSENEMKELFY